ncbi:glucose-6-phosphate isomerase [Limibaculum sp. FT325]|uniref:glucose-6-phosphate isomerase n=1 Tax=Thermohalobaculum sediminis TaxID=2939436 RepID=UPI0020BD7249|nr:glucose-6-phosphate isomerase [Limibaculum sediminis]MCL5776402.1 glucose-6-phosphate isomerase [Limibaculum sediminis]
MTEHWTEVHAHAERLRGRQLRRLFAEDPARFARLSFRLDDLVVDLSKEKLDAPALGALVALARAAGVERLRDAMAAGDEINLTEGRAVLHMALRDSVPAPEGDDVAGTRARFLDFAEAVRAGRFTGAGGPFSDVVNIGIGGSDLGPAMAARALRPDCDGPRLHFVSNVDGAHMADTLAGLDPARTLAVVASKTFTTLETMANARLVRDWLGAHAARQMAAVSTNLAGCAGFGIPESRVFGFWDWVGGRYSMWSAIGLALAIGIGARRFGELLAGAASMDRHFLTAPLERNLPVLLAMAGIWRRNVMGWPGVALIPYDQRLERFAAYVQQLDMESNGKRVTRDGTPVAMATGPVIWGEPGTNAQHSFFQLLHQGTDIVPVDFIAAARPRAADAGHHALLLANCLAQGQALAFGRSAAEVEAEMAVAGRSPAEIARLAPHRTFPGDRPSTTILFRELDAFALGRLTALFEHKVFVQGAVWGVNSFDQWGVELGKALAGTLIPAIRDGAPLAQADASTAGLAAAIRELGG